MPEIRHSVCALDCPDCCSLLVTVRGRPRDQAARRSGASGHSRLSVRQGGAISGARVSPGRACCIRSAAWAPRATGRFERISWDEALDTIAGTAAARWRDEFGPEAILPYSYAGTMGLLNGSGMDRRFFHRLGASRLDRTICSSAGGAGMTQALGVRYGTEPEQFRHSKLILAWGANILGTNVHLWPFIMEARRNGAKLYTIDPHRNRTGAASRQALLHQSGQRYRAGARHDARHHRRRTCTTPITSSATPTGFDGLRERVRAVDAAARGGTHRHRRPRRSSQLAREYATTRPAAIRLNYGVQRSERGATAVRTIALLPALTGSWKEVGGGLQLSTSQAFHLNRAGLERADLQQQSRWGARRASSTCRSWGRR